MNYEAMSTEEIVSLLNVQAFAYYSVCPNEDTPFRSCSLCDGLMAALNARGLDYDHGSSSGRAYKLIVNN